MKLCDLFLQEGRHDPYNYKVVFMAGSPGSGKTTIRRKIFGPDIKVVDVDALAALVAKKTQEQQQPELPAHPLAGQAERFRQSWLRQGLGMVIDGTGRNFLDYQQKRQQFQSYGYDTAMILVRTPLKAAQQNAARRQEQTGREVDPYYLDTTWQQVENNRDSYRELFGKTYWEITNWGPTAASETSQVARQVRQWLTTPVPV